MPSIPDLKLTSTSTATAYHFHPVKSPHNGWGWAICTVNDETGELAIQSDWGNWQHRWSADPKSLGSPTLTHFISGRSHCGYLADKLTTSSQRDRFDSDATVAAMRTRLAERRLEQGRAGERKRMPYEGTTEEPLTAELAREIWDAIGDIDSDRSADLFLDRFYRILGHAWVSEEPWNYIKTGPDSSYTILLEAILPALVLACNETVKERARAAMPECLDHSPSWFAGRWKDWHRGHGCNKDDGQPRTPEGEAEIVAGIAAGGRP